MSMPEARTANTGGLMRGKRGLVMGVANDHSIAWGIAKAVYEQGAELAFTYQGEALGKRVRPLAEIPQTTSCAVTPRSRNPPTARARPRRADAFSASGVPSSRSIPNTSA
jgi:hypothetical protein